MAFISILVVFIIVFTLHQSIEDKVEDVKPSALVQVNKASLRAMVKSIETHGSINFIPETMEQISVPTEIIITQIFVQNGDKVKVGQPLVSYKLSSQSAAALNNAQSTVEFAKKDYTRLIDLRTKYLANNSEVQSAQQALIKANTDLQSMSNNSGVIKAKSAGIISVISVQAGQVLAASTPILNIGHGLQAQLSVDAAQRNKIKLNMPVLIQSLNNPQHSVLIQIKNISQQIDPITSSFNFSGTLPQSEGFTAGDFISGFVYVESSSQQLAIPRTAVLYDNNHPYVFINQNGVAAMRLINILYSDESTIYFSGGVKLNEEVVFVGNYELESGMNLHFEEQP